MSNIGPRLRSERERLGLTQDALADAVQVSKRALINYEKGDRSPDADLLAAAASVGVDVLYVLTGQRSQPAPATSALTEGDRKLLENFHAAPQQVQAGVKTTLGAFDPSAGARRGKAA
ncbi:helix-turn-helix domain-containing protein [Acidovorax sp. SUPP2522]|uniref:helix-turn-helix domain-containing protein n=1 Tax=unclassified Acidovorax TaxID=2684926 RepID=UPI002349E358|nr:MULTISPECIES: helix-turn-helix domain-containing protein [unclassified Acidovorax]WCM99957.1 helix-turn-helix domain-containing protein [Acidovorax sp. GBBC 1281]GKT19741.1 helix-turn-helix domain-containing protein [Acidovorax sp. SUPP2522]